MPREPTRNDTETGGDYPGGVSEKEWAALVQLYESLGGARLAGLSALELDRLLPAGQVVPAWFKGVGRAIAKLRAKTPHADALLASSELAEMASRAEIARHRFAALPALLQGVKRIEMPACGAGVDALHLADFLKEASLALPLRLSDSDGIALRMCHYNLMAVYPKIHANFAVEDFLRPGAMGADLSGAYVYLDPARRSAGQRGGYAPALEPALRRLETARSAQIKLAPGEDLDALEKSAPAWNFEVLEYRGETLEITGTFTGPRAGPAPRRATRIASAGRPFASFAGRPETLPEAATLEAGPSVLLPSPTLRRAGLLGTWAHAHGVQPLGDSGLFSAISHGSPVLAESFNCLGMAPAKPKKLLHLLESMASGCPIELRALEAKPDTRLLQALRPFLSAKGASARRLTLLLTRAGSARIALLLQAS